MKNLVFNWSGGKDSSFALWKVMQHPAYKIDRLLTSVNSTYQRISMHGVRIELLQQQADSIGLPLDILNVPGEVDMDTYNQLMKSKMKEVKDNGIDTVVFGDIFLEDLRKYREDKLAEAGMKAIFPLWKMNTQELVKEFIDSGFKAITVCVDAQKLDESFVGRIIDHDFIDDLPDTVDPCGENGEFHSFVFDGPIFKTPVHFQIGEKVKREYPSDNPDWKSSFWFCDLAYIPTARKPVGRFGLLII